MKSSTLHRPSISKERITALEELISERSMSYDSSPGVYVRSDKDRELDILWQGFKLNSREERSPGIYLFIGFLTGAFFTFLMTAVLNMGSTSHENFADLNLWKKGNTEIKEKVAPITVTPGAQTPSVSQKIEKYAIQNGDTLESVAIKFYGSSAPEKIEQIQSASKITDPNKISIGQELSIPVEN